MLSRSHALRLHVESALAGRVSSPFRFQLPQPATASTGIADLDQLTGGLPRGCLTEVYGALSTGLASLLQAALAARTAGSEVCALVDAQDSFDPHGAQSAGVALQRLLWVRCRNINQALRSIDLLLHGGGFSLVAVDLTGAPERLVRQIPLNFWFRLRRTVENTSTILLVLSRESHARTCAGLVLRMERASARWSPGDGSHPSDLFHTPGTLLDGWTTSAEVIRSDARRKQLSYIDRGLNLAATNSPHACFDLRSRHVLADFSPASLPAAHPLPISRNFRAGESPAPPQDQLLYLERTQNFG